MIAPDHLARLIGYATQMTPAQLFALEQAAALMLAEPADSKVPTIPAPPPEPKPKPKCPKCEGAGWLWWKDLDHYSGPATETGEDDTQYPCDRCSPLYTPEPEEGSEPAKGEVTNVEFWFPTASQETIDRALSARGGRCAVGDCIDCSACDSRCADVKREPGECEAQS